MAFQVQRKPDGQETHADSPFSARSSGLVPVVPSSPIGIDRNIRQVCDLLGYTLQSARRYAFHAGNRHGTIRAVDLNSRRLDLGEGVEPCFKRRAIGIRDNSTYEHALDDKIGNVLQPVKDAG